MKTMSVRIWIVMSFALAGAACGASGGGDLGPPDSRCQSLCASADATCAADVSACQDQCQLRVTDIAPLCTTCLLDGASGGTCNSGAPCCPRAYFPDGVSDCSDACAGSTGVNPTDHPICDEICASSDASCSAEVTSCLDQCEARIAGVSGVCALCLLDGASGGDCASGTRCCPHPYFPTPVSACSAFCAPS